MHHNYMLKLYASVHLSSNIKQKKQITEYIQNDSSYMKF